MAACIGDGYSDVPDIFSIFFCFVVVIIGILSRVVPCSKFKKYNLALKFMLSSILFGYEYSKLSDHVDKTFLPCRKLQFKTNVIGKKISGGCYRDICS